MNRWARAVIVVAVAVAVTVVGGFVWRDHLQGLAGPGDRGAPRGDRHRDEFRPPRDDAFREPFGAPDGEHRPEGRDGRGGEWFSARGVSALGSAIPLAIVEACFRKREPGLISAPLRGKVGVYLVRVTAVAPPPPFAELNEVERTYVLDLVASQSPSRRGLTREFLDGVPVRYASDAPGRGR